MNEQFFGTINEKVNEHSNSETIAVITGITIATTVFTVATIVMAKKYMTHLDQVHLLFANHIAELSTEIIKDFPK